MKILDFMFSIIAIITLTFMLLAAFKVLEIDCNKWLFLISSSGLGWIVGKLNNK